MNNTVSVLGIATAMAFLLPKSLPLIQMLDPLQLNAEANMEPIGNDQILVDCIKEMSLQRWSVDDVVLWLQRNVPFHSERIEDCSRAFYLEGIDGLRLLTLQRTSHACSGMSDSEWTLLNDARERLLASHDKAFPNSQSNTSSPDLAPASSPLQEGPEGSLGSPPRMQNSRLTPRSAQKAGLLSSSFKLLSYPKSWWSSGKPTYEQKEVTAVHALQEEILGAEEREAALKAKVDHLDEILRTAQLSNYLYSRLRWTPLPGEPPLDDVDVDDWLQRFLVLEGSTIFFYPQAADLRPQGAILLNEIVEVGQIAGHVRSQDEGTTWFGFQITTCDGLRLECATTMKLQMELWLSSIQCAREQEQHKRG